MTSVNHDTVLLRRGLPLAYGERIRLRIASGSDAEGIWQSLSESLDRLLAEHDLSHVQIERASEPPEQSTGGKFRQVIPLQATETR